MKIHSERFGTIEFAPEEVIHFSSGVIGFPAEREFTLVRHGASSTVAWLQSTRNPAMALPVVSAHYLEEAYPDVPVEQAAEAAGLGADAEELAVLVVLCAPRNQPATVNLLAPIIVNATTRRGAQVFLEGSRFTTRELFLLPTVEDADSSAEASASAPSDDANKVSAAAP